jgi:phage terminase large subunit
MLKPMTKELLMAPSIFYPTHESTARRIVHQGGQWAGKTVNILISLSIHAVQNTSKNLGYGNEIITITSESVPHLRGGALRDFENFVLPYFEPFIKNYNRTDRIIYFKSGGLIEFKSFETESKARGAKRTRLFVNEANTFDYIIFFQLDSRTDIQTIIDYNPTAKFWAHDKLIGQEGTDFFISDHRHNPFLTEEKHREVESISDPELWKVYARGKTGNILGTIYPNWNVIDYKDFPNEDGIFWGLDFGYTNDPTALVKMCRIGESIFVHECSYTPGLSPTETVLLLKANGWKSGQPVYCEHDRDIIRQLRQLSVLAIPAVKGPGSISAGITKVKEFKMFYTYSSEHLKEELKRYVWVSDKSNGGLTNTPVDVYNHLLDAIRYGVYTNFYRGK